MHVILVNDCHVSNKKILKNLFNEFYIFIKKYFMKILKFKLNLKKYIFIMIILCLRKQNCCTCMCNF
jgi:hypothetical protein